MGRAMISTGWTVNEVQKEAVEREAEDRGVPPSAVIRDVIQSGLHNRLREVIEERALLEKPDEADDLEGRRAEVYNAVFEFQRQTGMSPSYNEIMEKVDAVDDSNEILRIFSFLEGKGLLKRTDPGTMGGYELINPEDEDDG